VSNILVQVLACSRPNYASAEFVFGEFVNTTGWPGMCDLEPMLGL